MTNGTPPEMPDCLVAALDYEKKGYSVIPLHSKSKRPLVNWKPYQRRRAIPKEIRQWWTQWPDANAGIVTGPISDCCVLDVDGKVGRTSITGRHIPETRVSVTGRDEGFHHWFKLLPGVAVPSINGLLPGVDLKGEGGYVVAPPSVHPTGRKYEWVDGFGLEMPPADLPAWILEEIKARKKQSASRSPEDYAALLRGVAEGCRHDATATLCGRYAALGVSQAEVAQMALNHNAQCDPPRDQEEVIRDATDICAREQEKRRAGPPGLSSPFQSPPYIGEETETGSGPYKALLLADFLKGGEGRRNVPWLVEGILPRKGIAMLSGWAGIGKSWMLMDLAVECGRGGKWLGQFPTTPCRVLYIDEESSEDLLYVRLPRLLADKGLQEPGLDIHMAVGLGVSLSAESSKAKLRRLIEDTQPGLVIVDSLIRVSGVDENSATDLARVFAVVKDLVRRFDCAFMIADHHKKPGQFSVSLDLMARGSGEKVAFVDTLLSLKKDGDLRVVEHSKSRYAAPVPSFLVRIEDTSPAGTTVAYDGPAEPAQRAARQEPAQRFVSGALESGASVPRQQLVERAKEAGISEKAVDEVLKLKVQEGVLVRESPERQPGSGRGGKPVSYRKSDLTAFLSQETGTETEREGHLVHS